jgi:hypothetical protein
MSETRRSPPDVGAWASIGMARSENRATGGFLQKQSPA